MGLAVPRSRKEMDFLDERVFAGLHADIEDVWIGLDDREQESELEI